MSKKTRAPKWEPDGKAEVLEALRKIGVKKVVAEYNGSGDSGQFESITAYADEEIQAQVDLSGHKLVATEKVGVAGGDGITETERVAERSLDSVVDDMVHDVLDHFFSGCFDNDGACGNITIDVVSGKIAVDHNWYVTETQNETAEA